MKTILLTGSTGFIGRNLKEQLQGYNFLTPSHEELDLTNQDKVYHYLLGKKIDVLIHSAGKEIQPCLNDNIRMFLNIIQFCNCKVLYFGSGAEEHRNSEYALSKKFMNEITQYEANVFNLRLYGVFGKYEDEHKRFLSVCCNSILKNYTINIYDNLKFDYLYVNDLVKIVEWFIENNPRDKEYDICTSSPLHLSDWADTLMDVSGKKIDLILHKNSGKTYGGDNSKFLEEFPFKFTPIEQSLKELYDYYRTR